MAKRIAMWSGPRNLSTAMMRAWGNRKDTKAVDEPFYAYYLNTSELRHPAYEEIIASQSTDWQKVVNQLSKESIEEAVFYQKHMTHHMLPEIDLTWCSKLYNCFLIRSPLLVASSYEKKNQLINANDIGIQRQHEIYKKLIEITDRPVLIVDALDVLQYPETVLKYICQQFEIPFTDRMLKRPKGKRRSDGVWASHWYKTVENSTGFHTYSAQELQISDRGKNIAKECEDDYLAMWENRFIPR
jgi:hypothetical protein